MVCILHQSNFRPYRFKISVFDFSVEISVHLAWFRVNGTPKHIVVVVVINSSSSRNWAPWWHRTNFRLAENSCVQVFCLHGNTLNVRKFRSSRSKFVWTEHIEHRIYWTIVWRKWPVKFFSPSKIRPIPWEGSLCWVWPESLSLHFFVLMGVIVWYQTVKSFSALSIRCVAMWDVTVIAIWEATV